MTTVETLDVLWGEIMSVPKVKEYVERTLSRLKMEDGKTYDCGACKSRGACCHQPVICDIYDAARFIDAGLDDYLEGTLSLNIKDERRLHIKRNGSACALLEDGKCGHYDLRPYTCRVYPFGISDDETVSFGDCLCRPVKGKPDKVAVLEAARGLDYEIMRTLLLIRHCRPVLKKTPLKKFLR